MKHIVSFVHQKGPFLLTLEKRYFEKNAYFCRQ